MAQNIKKSKRLGLKTQQKRRHRCTKLNEIKIVGNCGFLKTCKPNGFSKFIFVAFDFDIILGRYIC